MAEGVVKTRKLKDDDFDLPEAALADLKSLKDVLQRAVLDMLTEPGAMPLYADVFENPLSHLMIVEAVRKACESYVGMEGLRQLTFTAAPPTAEDRRLGRSATIVIAGPPEVLNQICFGQLETGKLSKLIDVDVVVEECEANGEA